MTASPNRSRANPPGRRGGKVLSTLHTRTSTGQPLGLVRAPQRYRAKRQRDNIYSITTPDIRRLARRGGVKRISFGVYHEARLALRGFLSDVSCCTVELTEGLEGLYSLCRVGKEEDCNCLRRYVCLEKERETGLGFRRCLETVLEKEGSELIKLKAKV
jgi:hypothetical protein